MEDKNVQSSGFVREKIKDKPVNKKKIAFHMLYMAVSGLVFGAAACVTFGVGYAIIRERNSAQTQEVDNSQVQVEPQVTTETQTEQPQEATETSQVQEFTVTDYQNMQYQLYNVGAECNKSVVSVTGVTSDTDIFNNSYESQGIGSGIIIEDNGSQLLILTERKVIRKASEIRVAFIDGFECLASVRGEDVNTGIAVLSVNKGAIPAETQAKIQVAVFSEYTASRAGTFVIAVGSPLDTNYSILTGYITSAGNKITTQDHNFSVVTTDIVGSGSSFGVLVNSSGEIVGVVLQSMHAAGNENTLVAISGNDIRPIINLLCDGESVPYMGLQVSTVSEHIEEAYGIPKGVYIREVAMDSPAMEAGLQSGDVIVKVNGASVNSDNAYTAQLMEKKPGDTISVVVKRKGANGYLSITYKVNLSVLEK